MCGSSGLRASSVHLIMCSQSPLSSQGRPAHLICQEIVGQSLVRLTVKINIQNQSQYRVVKFHPLLHPVFMVCLVLKAFCFRMQTCLGLGVSGVWERMGEEKQRRKEGRKEATLPHYLSFFCRRNFPLDSAVPFLNPPPARHTYRHNEG